MKIPIYQVDAFAGARFAGNPAAVCPLESWIYDPTLHDIAAENNAPATAFIVPRGAGFEIRWFTPAIELPLCGHGTLAAGFVALHHLVPERDEVRFASPSGELRVARDGERLALELPRYDAKPIAARPELAAALGAIPAALYATDRNLLAVFDDAAAVDELAPDGARLAALDPRGVIVTAPGGAFGCDFVSRFFAASHGGAEDPVTGSAHCVLAPYWATRLKRDSLFAKQISKRGGEIWCELGPRSVTLKGKVAPYLVGEIDV
jgi:PhzF family phenazine biosynthesis protein